MARRGLVRLDGDELSQPALLEAALTHVRPKLAEHAYRQTPEGRAAAAKARKEREDKAWMRGMLRDAAARGEMSAAEVERLIATER